MTLALVAGVAACGGDDDDAADTTTVESSVDTTTPAEITAPDTTAADSTDATTDGTADETTPAGSDGAPSGTDPATEGTDAAESDSTDESDGAAAAAASESSDAGDESTETTDEDGSDGSAAAVGPTTTGPECEFEENTSLPLERCDMGPAVAVVQSILQANGYEVGIDGNFGDQTIYAVRAFQEEEGLTVDGVVGVQTWSELGVDEQYGTDANGDGVIAPDELDLTE